MTRFVLQKRAIHPHTRTSESPFRETKKPTKPLIFKDLMGFLSGGGGIRTPEGLAPLPVFKTGAFGRSATPPLVIP